MNPTALFLSILIKESRKNFVPDNGIHVSTAQWISEMRTIKLGLPRRSGKTTAIVELAAKHPSLIVCHNSQMTDHLRRAHGVRAFSAHNLSYHSYGGDNELIELLLVDEGFLLPAETQHRLVDFTAELWAKSKVDRDKFVMVCVGT